MGITSAFNNAFSGLNASSRRAELISNNIANAMTDGFSRRQVHLSSDVLNGSGGGVRVGDVSRIENAVLSSGRRGAEAVVAAASSSAGFISRFADVVGEPGEAGALGVQLSELESAFTAAANDPSSEIALDEVVARADGVSKTLNGLSEALNGFRTEADTEIARQVDAVNLTLEKISELNIEVRTRTATGAQTASTEDQRNLLIDSLNSIIPVSVVKREHGQVALFTPNGGTLLDGKAAQFDFSKSASISHGMTVGNGALSSLTVIGAPVSVNSSVTAFEGGSLGALFDIRDGILPAINDNLDALASDFITRFQSPTVDPSLGAADPGLFTDDGSQFLGPNQLGLAGRLLLNPAVDPSVGGQSWKLRDGLNSVAPGDVGQNTILRNYSVAVKATAAPAVGMNTASALSAAGFAAAFASEIAADRVAREDDLVFKEALREEFKESELAVIGVDTDAELQDLIEVEAAYAANARVMSVLDRLLDKLLEI